ncbi:uncharacterized protein LOC111639251 [Centruroides sculpturatus]|uniref:uncharacterized protein LOC111639251 n=1 Tax=Centruroides sculpturatus TaxID=218467 RepID=UPI000C6E24E4|nr:uncharacterized protein LOC111639251 [Centruroides sculpturatus]
MDRASKAIRRSGVRLKSIGGGHADLNMVISELKDMRQAAKAFMAAQNSVRGTMAQRRKQERNGPEAATRQVDLGEMAIALAGLLDCPVCWERATPPISLCVNGHIVCPRCSGRLACEQRELKIRKELKRAAKKATDDEINNLEIKLSQAERAKDLAQLEVVERVYENEAIKLIRLKDGLLKLSDAYIELANKSAIIFEAQREISHQLPDVHGRDLHEIKYTGTGMTKHAVVKARDKVQQYQQLNYRLVATSLEDPPPPYTPEHYHPLTGNPYEEDNRYSSQAAVIQRQRAIGPTVEQPTCPSPPPQQERNSSSLYPWNADIRWDTSNNYEESISEAMGAAKI